MNAVVAHLRRIGYVEGVAANDRRGQYAIRGTTIEIRTGHRGPQ
jgi:hypothetical protein